MILLLVHFWRCFEASEAGVDPFAAALAPGKAQAFPAQVILVSQ
ncbi:hypothetical protein [Accumulibacter sp.]|nr:hypothetical protein [Accumulibacter sp.]